ncbi:MAG: hypothetical protein ABR557_01400 [Pyrinomonadaceae bacterium]
MNSLRGRRGWDRTGRDPIQSARDYKSSPNRRERASLSRRRNPAPVISINSFLSEKGAPLAISLFGRFAFQLEAPDGQFTIFSNVNDQHDQRPGRFICDSRQTSICAFASDV